ncbi:hypothetical protein ABPG72_020065 [Tetrahymena utriculariae]
MNSNNSFDEQLSSSASSDDSGELDQFKLSDSDQSSNENSDEEQEESQLFWKKYTNKNKLINMLPEFQEQNDVSKEIKHLKLPIEFQNYFLIIRQFNKYQIAQISIISFIVL